MEMAREFLTKQGLPKERVDRVAEIIENVGFKNELGRIETAAAAAIQFGTAAAAARVTAVATQVDPLLAIVQDADRLDAIGALGIARCFTFGGAKGRPMFDPDHAPNAHMTKEEYAKGASAPSINHFYEKLLKLKDLMKTSAGRRRAAQRHQVMVQFLKDFDDEWFGRA